MTSRISISSAIVSIFAVASLASVYPKFNETVHWNTGTFGNGTWYGLSRQVQLSSSTSEDRKIFHSVSLVGAKIGGVVYSSFSSSGESVANVSADTRSFLGTYVIGGKTLKGQMLLRKDGTFNFQYQWTSPGVTGGEVYLRVDYDLIDAADDIVDWVVNNDGTEQWHAMMYPPTISYPAMQLYNSQAIERNAYCRIADSRPAQEQLYAVFWPIFTNTAVDFTFKLLSGDNFSLPPQPDMNGIQSVQTAFMDHVLYDRYAYSAHHGGDQVAYITLKPSGSATAMFGIGGRAFQRPNARPLVLNAFIHTNAYNFAADLDVPTLNNRTMRQALNDLTNSTLGVNVRTNLAYNFTDEQGKPGAAAWWQVHDFMVSARNVSPPINNSAYRNDYWNWFTDICVLNVADGTNATTGVMFDQSFYNSSPGYTYNPNHIEREGAVVFWPTVKGPIVDAGQQKAFGRAVILHEIGHTFNLIHSWGSCGGLFNPNDCSNGTIMTYSMFGSGGPVWNGTGTFTWDATAPINTYGKNLNWYQNAPESWVKPGRYGSFMIGGNNTEPPFFYNY